MLTECDNNEQHLWTISENIIDFYTYICTLMIAFPTNVEMKKTLNGIKKWPQVIPAKSKSGFGIFPKFNKLYLS
jgi:hypothetical protein